MNTSWRTTLAGMAGSLGTALTAMSNETAILVGKILLALSVFYLGSVARDRMVSSEDEQIK
tara:strand:- start:693 stop:875 length:183 start_codon:yes stop_codon:yes gene_type:complete